MVITDKKDSMATASKVAAIATEHITAFLKSRANTIELVNVEDSDEYRKKDIDLIWKYKSTDNQSVKEVSIEIKGDNYFNTGNYFFETLSNQQKNTPGCFMYSQADFLYYYFIEKELHIIPLKNTRDWFKKNIDHFQERKTTTPVGNFHYNTVGKLVPRNTVLENIPDIRIFPFKNGMISSK